MAEFGKRNAVRVSGVRAQPQPQPAQTSVSAALQVAGTGKMPAWTKIGPIRLALCMLLLPAVYFWGIFPYAGDVLRDHRLAGTWRTAYDLQAFEGRCTRHNFLVTNCSVKVKSRAEPNQKPVEVDYMMGFVSGGGVALIPVRSTSDPSVVTIAYAADAELWNRTLTFLVMTGTLAAGFFLVAFALVKGRYNGGAAHLDLLAGLSSLGAKSEPAAAGRRAAA